MYIYRERERQRGGREREREREREFKSMNSSGIVFPYLSIPIGKPFLVSIFFLFPPD